MGKGATGESITALLDSNCLVMAHNAWHTHGMHGGAVLNRSVRESGLLAIGVLLLQRDAAKGNTTTIDLTKVSTISGDAEQMLLASLGQDVAGWSEWLAEPSHVNAAASLSAVLTDDLKAKLVSDCDASLILEVLDQVTASREQRRTQRKLDLATSTQSA
jgi:hypothetical protein